MEIVLWRDISIYEFSRAPSARICISQHTVSLYNCCYVVAVAKAINVVLRIICSLPKISMYVSTRLEILLLKLNGPYLSTEKHTKAT